MNVGLIFGMIFALIVIGFVFIFGGRQIMSIMNISNSANIYNNIEMLEKEVANLYAMSENSAKEINIYSGDGMKVCFVDPERSDISENGWVADGKYDFIAKQNGYNVMIIRNDNFDGKKIAHLKPRHNFCITSKKTLLIVNKGYYVDITGAQNG